MLHNGGLNEELNMNNFLAVVQTPCFGLAKSAIFADFCAQMVILMLQNLAYKKKTFTFPSLKELLHCVLYSLLAKILAANGRTILFMSHEHLNLFN